MQHCRSSSLHRILAAAAYLIIARVATLSLLLRTGDYNKLLVQRTIVCMYIYAAACSYPPAAVNHLAMYICKDTI